MKKNLLTILGLTAMASMSSAQYCVDGGPSNTADTNLQGVELVGTTTTIDHTVTCPGDVGVSDLTALSADLDVADGPYTLTVEWGKCGATTYSSYGSVWIDFDGSESFSPDELIGDFSIAYGGTYTPSIYTIDVPPAALNGTRRMRIMQTESGSLPLDPCASFSYGSVHDFSIEITGGVDCAPPTTVVLDEDELTPTTAKLDWDFIAVEEWQWALVLDGETPTAADFSISPDFPTSGIVTDLTSNTEYDFYVRAICGVGDTSSFNGPTSFRTPCETISGDDFCESFEADSESESCWTVLDGNDDGDTWDMNYGSNPHTGSQSAVMYTDFNSGANDDWLISPRLNLDSPKFLSFWYRVQSSGEPNDFEVLLSTTGKEPADFTNTLMALAEYDNTEYADTLIDLAAFASMDVYIAFHVPAGGLDGWRLYVDDVCITNCPPLGDLVLDGVTPETSNISWTPGGDETDWVVSYGEPGFTPGEGTEEGTDTDSYEITGLTANTDYEVYVRTICAGGDSTLWVGPLPFHTSCYSMDPAVFCESFEDDSETEGCWSTLDVNGDGDAWDINYGFNAHTGSQSAVMYTDFNFGANDDWLISPNVTLTGNEVLTYWQRVQSAGEPNDFEILLSTTGSNPADFTTTILALEEYSNTEYVETTIDLSDYTGEVFIAFHVPAGGLDGWRLYLDDICFNICDPADGTDGSIDVCVADENTDLDLVISGAETFGTWSYDANPLLIDGSTFDFSGLAVGTYNAEYVVVGGCSNDTTIATINVFGAPNSGEGSTIEACMNENVSLLSGLSGTIDTDGVWANADGDELPESSISTFGVDPGTYVYTYTVSNGVCEDEVAEVTLIVGDCDYLTIDGNELEALNIYPNPTNDFVYVSVNGTTETFSYEVLDVTGRVIVKEVNAINGTNNVTIDLTDQESGVYMVKVYNGSVEKTVRIAKN